MCYHYSDLSICLSGSSVRFGDYVRNTLSAAIHIPASNRDPCIRSIDFVLFGDFDVDAVVLFHLIDLSTLLPNNETGAECGHLRTDSVRK